tara:strand:+ start:3455 stop:6034 length:2580 start_codon:yes stop_codon:yes gene_type:complete
MMTFSKVSDQNYYLNLAAEDYYLKGGEPPGVWVGAGAKILKLKGKVEASELNHIMDGFTPEGKQALCQQTGKQHQSGWDLTFGAPKSISVLWAAAHDELKAEIQKAQLYAVKMAMAFIEENAAYTRRGAQGSEREKVAGLVTALFEHSTSRALDPHLHTHAVLANIAPREDGTWGTIDSRTIMNWQKAAGMIYKASLAGSIRELGFETEADNDSFKVKGVSEKICMHFSKRSQQITKALKKAGIKSRTSKAGDIVALATRDTKTKIDRPALFKKWQMELSSNGLDSNVVDKLRLTKIQLSEIDPFEMKTFDEQQLLSELTENNSTFRLQDAFFHAGKLSIQHNQANNNFQYAVQQAIQSKDAISLGVDWKHNQLFTTKTVIETEQIMVDTAKRLRSSEYSKTNDSVINRIIDNQPFDLSEEQRFAVLNVCDGSQLSILQGSAGSGKSASMLSVRDVYKAQNKQVIGAAISKAAANNLAQEADIECHTIARLLLDLNSKKPPLTRGDVLIVDEAGQLGTFQMKELLCFSENIGFKVILVGEDKQLDAIQHGGVLRYLSSPEIIGTTRVETIRRQTESWDRKAVADFRDGYAHQALAQYSQRGQLYFADNDEAAKVSLINAWSEFRHLSPDKKSLVIAQSWNDVIQLNNQMRRVLQSEGLVGHDNIPVKGTVSERDIEFNVSVGERIRFTKNDYNRKYTNGDIGTVTKVQLMDDGDIWLRVHLDSGRQTQFMLSDYCNEDGRAYLTQAYAQTVYSSQGLTMDGDVFVYYTQNMDRAHSYVSCSRHKDKAHIFANSQELEDDIPEAFKHAPHHKGLLEALAKNMSRENRPKLAIEHLSDDELFRLTGINRSTQIEPKKLILR